MEKNKLSAIFLDMDNTIIHYSDENIHIKILSKWLRVNGVKNPRKLLFSENWSNLEKRLNWLGISNKEYIKSWNPKYPSIEESYKLKAIDRGNATIDEGFYNLINGINLPIILVSNTDYSVVKKILDRFNIRDKFDYIFKRKYDIIDLKKPNSSIAMKIYKIYNIVNPKEVIMIGDSDEDILFAKNSGMISINVKYKKGGADYYFHTLNDTVSFLRDNYPGIFNHF